MLNFLRPLFPMGQLARSTYITASWMVLRVALQTVWVAFIAHALGPDGYGFLAGITALAATLGTFTGMGSGVLLLQDASRDARAFPLAWKRALAMSVLTGCLLSATYIMFVPNAFPIHGGRDIFTAVAVTEVLCFPIITNASYAFQAHERMGWAGTLQAAAPAGNVVAVGLFGWLSHTRSLDSYMHFHATMAVVMALTSIALVKNRLSPSPTHFVTTSRDLKEGFGFSIMRLADTALVTLDKTLALRIAGSHPAGIYSAAYRLVSVASLPLISLSMSALPRLFRANRNDLATGSFVRTLVVVVVVYGVFSGMAIWFLAGLLPMILGDGFRPSIEVARWMAASPLLQGLYMIGANLLVTQKMVGLRVVAQLLTLGVMLLAAIILIPTFGLAGMVGMLLVTQLVGASLMWACYAWGRYLAHKDSLGL